MKRFLLFNVSVLALLMMFALPINAAQADGITTSVSPAAAPIHSGGCGNDNDSTNSSNVTWSFDSATGILTISGSGEMRDYNHPHHPPYYYLRDDIQGIVIESGVTGIGNRAFRNFEDLTSVTFADSVTSIGESSFANCDKLTEFAIPNNITDIGKYAFSGCWRITSLTIGEGVTSIGKGAFEDLKKLVSIQWNATNVADFSTHDEVFNFAGFFTDGITVTFGEKVTAIPAYAFFTSSYNTPRIKTATVNEGTTSIGDYAFGRLKSLTSITIPFSTTSIGCHAFYKYSEDFLIYGYTFSYAETYADENEIPFSSLGYKYFDILYYDGEDQLTLTPAEYAYGVGESNLPTPEKTGHIFDGWYNNEDLTGDTVTAIDTAQTGAFGLYAKWTLTTYDITVTAGENGSITPDSATVNFGDDQAFTITPDTGYEIEDVLIDGTSVGAVESYTFEDVTTNHTIAATFKKAITITFTDVPAGIEFEGYVYDLAGKGIICGYANDDGTYEFRPYQNITRAEFATILARMSGEDLSAYENKYSFKDIPEEFWATEYIEWAYQKGVVKGIGGGKFAPDDPITRQEMAVMIYRFATVYKGETLPQNNAALTFTDVGDIASWAAEAVSAMQQAGIIDGIANSNGTFRFAPESNAIRAHAAKMISVYLSL